MRTLNEYVCFHACVPFVFDVGAQYKELICSEAGNVCEEKASLLSGDESANKTLELLRSRGQMHM